MKINNLNKYEVLFNRETAQKPKVLSVSSTSMNESITKFKYTILTSTFVNLLSCFQLPMEEIFQNVASFYVQVIAPILFKSSGCFLNGSF